MQSEIKSTLSQMKAVFPGWPPNTCLQLFGRVVWKSEANVKDDGWVLKIIASAAREQPCVYPWVAMNIPPPDHFYWEISYIFDASLDLKRITWLHDEIFFMPVQLSYF